MNAPSYTSVDFTDSVPLRNLLRHALPYVSKVPQTVAMDLLRQKYIEFARRTRLLCTELSVDLQAGVPDYYLQAPDDHEIYSILGIPESTGWGWYGQGPGINNRFDVLDNNGIVLRTTPSVDRAKGLNVWVTLLPKECIDYIPRSIATPFGQRIAKGVLSDMLNIPNKEWTNPSLARKFELDYERMLLSARALSSSNRKVDSTSFKPIRIL